MERRFPAEFREWKAQVISIRQDIASQNEAQKAELDAKIEDTKKQQKLASRNNKVLLEKLEEKELEVTEMKTKCGGLEQKDKEMTRKYATFEQQNKEQFCTQ